MANSAIAAINARVSGITSQAHAFLLMQNAMQMRATYAIHWLEALLKRCMHQIGDIVGGGEP